MYKLNQRYENICEHLYEHSGAAIYLLAVTLLQTRSVVAADPFAIFGNVISTVYSGLLGLTTGLVIVWTVIQLIRKMPAEGQDKARISASIKDAWIGWFIINILGSLLAYGQSFVKDNGISDLTTL